MVSLKWVQTSNGLTPNGHTSNRLSVYLGYNETRFNELMVMSKKFEKMWSLMISYFINVHGYSVLRFSESYNRVRLYFIRIFNMKFNLIRTTMKLGYNEHSVIPNIILSHIGHFSSQINLVITNTNGRSRAVRYKRVWKFNRVNFK